MLVNTNTLKLGDQVFVFMDKDYETIQKGKTNNVLYATVIGVPKPGADLYDCGVLFGWKKDEKSPRYSSSRAGAGRPAALDYLPNQHEYIHGIRLEGNIDYLVEVGGGNRSEAKTLAPAKDIADWKAWAHNIPGDCPCGMKRSECSYHR